MSPPPVEAVVLAAGRARRMGRPKHLIEVGGAPMLARVIGALRASRARDVCAVLRPGDAAGAECARAAGARAVWAEDAGEGRAASVRAGVRATPEGVALLVALADQPYLEAADFDALVAALDPPRHTIVYARYAGARGSPALFAPDHRDELLALRGSQGGRVVIARHPGSARGVDLDPTRGRDLDRPEDLGC